MKKANKKVSTKENKSAQKADKPSARSSHVTAKKAAVQKRKTTKPVTPQPETLAVTNIQNDLPVTSNTSRASNLQTNILRVLALIAVIAISLYVVSIREHVAQFKQYGYAGIFFIALLANATVFIPAPGVAIIYAMGAVFNPLYVGFAAGTGGAIGELSGFVAGLSGQAIVENTDIYHRIKPWVEKYGGWAILVLAAIPNPFFDLAGVAAGIVKMPMRTFLFSVWIGQLIKMTMFAVAGHYSIEWMSNLFRQ